MFSLTQNYLTRGFWGDEAWTSLISQLPYGDMLKTTAADFHPPGYYTVVGLVYKFLAPTEIATRSISIIFYLLTIFMVYKLASAHGPRDLRPSGSASMFSFRFTSLEKFYWLREIENKLASFVRGKLFGLLSAVVVALNPIFFTYAFEARNYTMFAFSATGSVYFLIELSKKFTWQRIIGFILFSTLGIYTHYYMFFILAAQGIYILLYDRQIILRMIGAYVVVGFLYLPWIPFLAGQLSSVAGDYWIGGIDQRTHYEALFRILGGEHKNIFRPWLFGLSIMLLIVGIGQHILRHKFEKPYLFTWLWATIPFILASLPGFKVGEVSLPFRPIFFWRYLIGSSVPLSMVMVHTAQRLPKSLFGLAVGALVILSIAIDIMTFSRQPYTFREVYKEKVVSDIQQNDAIVTVLPSFAEVLYYRNRNNLGDELVVLPEGLVQFSGKSLLDAYEARGSVRIDDYPQGRYYELRPGPSAVRRN